MKNRTTLLIAIAIIAVACSRYSYGYDEGPNISIPPVVNTWGSTQEEIKNQIQGVTPAMVSDNLVVYYDPASTVITSYSFDKDNLVTVASIVPGDKSLKAVTRIAQNYTQMGEVDDASIYYNLQTNTLLTICETSFEETAYVVLGYTPIVSDAFPYIEPVSLSIKNVSQITISSATISGEVSNAGGSVTCGVQYGTTASFADGAQKKTVQTSSKIEVSLSGLQMGTRYYYRLFAIVDGFTYYSNVDSFTTETAKTYQIGDKYPDAATCIGIVFDVNSTGISGKIVGLDIEHLYWDEYGIFCTDYGYNSSDGSYNNGPSSTSLAVGWCKHYKDGTWYCPATGELKSISKNYSIILPQLHGSFNTEIDYWFWSSTQYSNNHAYIINLSTGAQTYNSKNVARNVVAVKKF